MYDPAEVLDWNAARREEITKQTGCDPWDLDRYGSPKPAAGVRADPNYVCAPLAKFREQELDRCDPWSGGFWFYNNGVPVWLTPFHYFYLTWWEINVGYPQYRDTDRRKFYLWQWAFEHPRCLGLCEVAKRGEGKTYRALSVLYQRTIFGRNILSGIQSKTDDDAKDMFQIKLVECYKNLPDFLVPINDNSSDPKENLRFFAPSKRGKASMYHRLLQQKAIRSTINYKNAQEKAYDGQTVNGVLLRDEEGKTKPSVCDVWSRHLITRNCVFRDGKTFGKIYSTTTVDKLESGGEQYKKMWDGSNQLRVTGDDPAETVSGMIRIFLPAYETESFDEYGNPDIEKARRRQKKERMKLADDPKALLEEILMFPWDESELFASSGDTCQYDLTILRMRERVVSNPEYNMVRTGDFYWEDGIVGGRAMWRDNPDNGKWQVAYLFDDPKQSNKVLRRHNLTGTEYTPDNEEKFVGGFDPTKTSKQVDKRRSSAAGAIFMKFDPWFPDFSETWIADYVCYPTDPEEGWMDFLIGLFYYGAPFLPESNLGIPSKIKELGFEKFVMYRPENTFSHGSRSKALPGMPSTEQTNDYMIKRKQTHIVKFGSRLLLPRVIRDSIAFDPQCRTKYDLEVATQFALVAAERPMRERAVQLDVTDLFESWDNSGVIGRLN